MKKPHLVILGGGFGGLSVARGLRDQDVKITLIDRRNHHLFQPLLYQVATAGLSPADIAAPIRGVIGQQENTEVLMAEATGINPHEKKVLLEDREIQYDYLVIATGAGPSFFGKDHWADIAPGLKTIADAVRIRRKILTAFEAAEMETDEEKKKAWLTFVVVGGGPTGVEMAGAISELAQHALVKDFRNIDPTQARIVLVEANQGVLAGFPESLSMRSLNHLQRKGVEIQLGSLVESLDENGVVIAGKKLESKTIIWCAGVVASDAGKWLGVKIDQAGRVEVGPDLSVPGFSEVYAIGDTAVFYQNEKPLPGVAPVAMQQGRYVAKHLKHRFKGKKFTQGFRYLDKGNLATVGRGFAVAAVGRLKMSGFFAWLVWVVVHIYYLVGFRNRVLVMLQWAWHYLTFQSGARLITSAEQESRDRSKKVS